MCISSRSNGTTGINLIGLCSLAATERHNTTIYSTWCRCMWRWGKAQTMHISNIFDGPFPSCGLLIFWIYMHRIHIYSIHADPKNYQYVYFIDADQPCMQFMECNVRGYYSKQMATIINGLHSLLNNQFIIVLSTTWLLNKHMQAKCCCWWWW